MALLYYTVLLLDRLRWQLIEKEIICAILLFVSVILITRCYCKDCNLPPGPYGLPYFGYLFFLKGKALHLKFASFAKTYGEIFSIRLGPQLVVVINDHKLIRETFAREEFTGRPHNEFMKILGGYGEYKTQQIFLIFYLY